MPGYPPAPRSALFANLPIERAIFGTMACFIVTAPVMLGLLQCKWAYWGEDIELAPPSSRGKVRQIIAALLHPKNVPSPDGVEFWSRRHIASLMIKHSGVLPLAVSLRIWGSN
jgi:hypothetical protein